MKNMTNVRDSATISAVLSVAKYAVAGKHAVTVES